MTVSTLSRAMGTALLLLLTPLSEAAGLLTPTTSGLPELSIKQHHVEVTIEDGYAITQVSQVFFNPHSQPLDAIYSFPLPEKAAVGEFTYWINNKPITAEVVEKAQARQIYNEEKQAGREVAIVEKDDYKTFDITVADVQPQQNVRVRLVYIQPAHVDTGIGRYVYPLEDGGVDEQKLAFWTRNETVDEQFSFNVQLRNSYPIDTLRLPSTPNAQVIKHNDNEWEVSISQQQINEGQPSSTSAKTALNNDIVMYWRHADGLPGTVDLVAHKQDANTPGTFMLTLTPGDDLAPLNAGRDWVFVLDVSGSMKGKYNILIDGVRQGLTKLSPQDRFRIVLFNKKAHEFSGGFRPATPASITPLLDKLEQFQPNSGTNLYAGLKSGLSGLDADRPTAIVLITDGVANVGVTEKREFLHLLEKTDLRLFTFIMGNSANRPLLEEMTKISDGFALSVSNADDMMGHILLAANKMSHEALRDITLTIDGGRITDLTPEDIGSIYRGQQLSILGHYRKAGPVTVTLTGKTGSKTRTYKSRILLPETAPLNPELERLWAYATIEALQERIDYLGEDSDSKQAITDIARTYGLITFYTSMIVVRDERFQQLGIDRTNQTRVATEQKAREQRKASAVRNNRADQTQPMFTKPRPTLQPGSGGAGSVGSWAVVLILLMLIVHARKSRRDLDASGE